MLVLEREKDEAVIVTMPDGQRMTVMVVRAHGGSCRLGFDADKSVKIHRAEVQARIDAEGARK